MSATPTNAEVRLFGYPAEPTVFVAMDRLHKCYPEQMDECWLGHKMKTSRRRNPQCVVEDFPVDVPQKPPQKGPVTRSIKKKVT